MPFQSSARGKYGAQGMRAMRGPLAPVWVTSGSLGSSNQGTAISIQLNATDDSGRAPTYSLASGTLPGGTTLSSSGLLSGTTNNSGTFNFTVRATDENGSFTDSSTLSYTSVQPAFTTFDITTTLTGPSGPTSTGQFTQNIVGTVPTWSVSSGYVDLTIPTTATYRIECWGAKGGDGAAAGDSGGYGAYARGEFSLTAGTILKMIVGQRGINGSGQSENWHGGGGGGGTFVAQGSDRNSNTLLIAAGGGAGSAGGNNGRSNDPNRVNGQASTSGQSSNSGGGGGAGPNGGGGATSGGTVYSSAGGAGFSGNGGGYGSAAGGTSYRNGGTGGSGAKNGNGGFGGGGAGQLEGGGGGGYGGGGGSTHGWSISGGGGSFISGSNQAWTTGANTGQGRVLITRLT